MQIKIFCERMGQEVEIIWWVTGGWGNKFCGWGKGEGNKIARRDGNGQLCVPTQVSGDMLYRLAIVLNMIPWIGYLSSVHSAVCKAIRQILMLFTSTALKYVRYAKIYIKLIKAAIVLIYKD